MIYREKKDLTIMDAVSVSNAELWSVFAKEPYTVIYLEDNTTEALLGIISLGDYVRHCTEQRKCINQKFTKLLCDDSYMENKAEEIFKEKTHLNQIPVVDGNNKLIGEFSREMESQSDLLKVKEQKNLVKQYLQLCQRDMLVVMEDIAVKLWRLKYQQAVSLREISTQAENFIWMYNLLIDLAKKEISVCFFGRPGIGKLESYSEQTRFRIQNQLSFVKMSEDVESYQGILENILGNYGNKQYVKELCSIPPILNKGKKSVHIDWKSHYVNVTGGRRVTVMQPEKYEHSIYMYGRCGVFGYAVEDKDTLPSALQRHVNKSGVCDRVVNCGLWGAGNTQILQNLEQDIPMMKKGDQVVLYMEPFVEEEMACFMQMGMTYYDCTEKYYTNQQERELFYDKPGHMTARGYDVVAGHMWNVMWEHKSQGISAETSSLKKITLSQNEDRIFELRIKDYVRKIREKHKIDYKDKKIGAIVMNCNPFTLGHYYLIESSAKKVDYLFAFVVEEDKSYFPFLDRIKMVQAGTENLKNVFVEPSGQFMIASETFPEYFLKEQLKEVCLDASRDLELFATYIAPELNISVRFAGEEPLDPLTRQYNDAMRETLPAYHIEFCEIPRKKQGNQVISASAVRALMEQKKEKELEKMVPHTTYVYLREQGFLKD